MELGRHQHGRPAPAAARGKGKAIPQDFQLHAHVRQGLAGARQAVCTGKHFKTAKLTARKAGEGQKEFLVMTMKEVFVTAVSPAAASGGDIHGERVAAATRTSSSSTRRRTTRAGLGGGRSSSAGTSPRLRLAESRGSKAHAPGKPLDAMVTSADKPSRLRPVRDCLPERPHQACRRVQGRGRRPRVTTNDDRGPRLRVGASPRSSAIGSGAGDRAASVQASRGRRSGSTAARPR